MSDGILGNRPHRRKEVREACFLIESQNAINLTLVERNFSTSHGVLNAVLDVIKCDRASSESSMIKCQDRCEGTITRTKHVSLEEICSL